MPKGRPKVPRVKVTCANCGKEVEKYFCNIKNNKTGRFFCTEDCRREMGSKMRTQPLKTCEVCGKEFVSYSKGRFCSKAHYDEWQRRNRVSRICERCGTEFWLKPSQITNVTGRWCSHKCETDSRLKRTLERTHNGRPVVLDKQGYARVYEPDHPRAMNGGWVFEHRLIAEQRLGRRLERNEHVHHMNGKKDDNRPENLAVVGHGEHSTITGLENGRRLREWEEYQRRFGPLEL